MQIQNAHLAFLARAALPRWWHLNIIINMHVFTTIM